VLVLVGRDRLGTVTGRILAPLLGLFGRKAP